MLDVAGINAVRPRSKVALRIEARAQAIDLADVGVDAVSIAFRDPRARSVEGAAREVARVTRIGGRIAILRLSGRGRARWPSSRAHIPRVVPRVGALISGGGVSTAALRRSSAFTPRALAAPWKWLKTRIKLLKVP
jgi:ubiquinone/menaquinone biosynthesis C-methylase UbiE